MFLLSNCFGFSSGAARELWTTCSLFGTSFNCFGVVDRVLISSGGVTCLRPRLRVAIMSVSLMGHSVN